MKICCNSECRHFKRTGKPAEYGEQVESCADCGTVLVLAEAAPASATAEETNRGPVGFKWATTIGLSIVPLFLMTIGIPGVDRGFL
jgi:hypothetical protein